MNLMSPDRGRRHASWSVPRRGDARSGVIGPALRTAKMVGWHRGNLDRFCSAGSRSLTLVSCDTNFSRLKAVSCGLECTRLTRNFELPVASSHRLWDMTSGGGATSPGRRGRRRSPRHPPPVRLRSPRVARQPRRWPCGHCRGRPRSCAAWPVRPPGSPVSGRLPGSTPRSGQCRGFRRAPAGG